MIIMNIGGPIIPGRHTAYNRCKKILIDLPQVRAKGTKLVATMIPVPHVVEKTRESLNFNLSCTYILSFAIKWLIICKSQILSNKLPVLYNM